MPLPLTDLYKDGLSPWEECGTGGSRPDRTVFGLGQPARRAEGAGLMERQVGEFGAKAFKFYNVRYDYGAPFPGGWTIRGSPFRSSRRRNSWA
jgi:hypothetical protein